MKEAPLASCTVCAEVGVRKIIDGYLEEGVTGAGISRSLAKLGLNVSPEVVNRHKTHYAPPETREKGTRKKDFAVMVRDKALETFEEGKLDLADKDHAPGINAGLKAQAILDKREQQKVLPAAGGILLELLARWNGTPAAPLQIEDGNTIEGDFSEVD